MQSQSHIIINSIIINKMGKIEDITGKMFHEAVSKEFEKQCIDATDTTDLHLKSAIIARLDTIIENLK